MKKSYYTKIALFAVTVFTLVMPCYSQVETGKDLEKLAAKVEKEAKRVEEKAIKAAKKAELVAQSIPGIPPLPAIPAIPPIPPIPKSVVSNLVNQIENFDGEIVREAKYEEFSFDGLPKLVMDTTFSNIKISSHKSAGNVIKVSYEIVGGAKTKEMAQELFDRFQVSLEKSRDQLKTTVSLKEDNKSRNGKQLMTCLIEIQVPEQSPLECKNDFGELSVDGIKAQLVCRNSFGQTVISDTEGDLNLHTQYGNTYLTGHHGKAMVKGEFGDSTINSMNGDLDVAINYGNAHLGGFDKEAKIRGKVSFSTVNMSLPPDFSGTLSAKGDFGTFNIKPEKNVERKRKSFHGETVYGKWGEGSGEVSIDAGYSTLNISIAETE